jgi:hypothetical protein
MNLNELSEVEFTRNDLTEESITRITEEAIKMTKGIIEGGVSRDSLQGIPRSFQDIQRDCENGLVAEQYLIQEQGYRNNPKMWHDVISPQDVEVEVKTFRYNYIQTKFEHILKLEYRKTKYPHVVMFMRTEDVYTFDSYFKYNYEKEKYDPHWQWLGV